MGVRFVAAWLVAACSGVTLILGFIAIFARIRSRTAWAIAAGLGLRHGDARPEHHGGLAQSSLMGAALTALGLVIQGLHDRATGLVGRKSRARPRLSRAAIPRSNALAAVGSDDSTAIRVRTPSTMDYPPLAAGRTGRSGGGEELDARAGMARPRRNRADPSHPCPVRRARRLR